MSTQSRQTPSYCPRCLRQAEESATGQRRSMRGYAHRKLHLRLDDERALAAFFAVHPEALGDDTMVTYLPQGEGQDPRPVITSGLLAMQYGLWCDDHAVGQPTCARALVRLGETLFDVYCARDAYEALCVAPPPPPIAIAVARYVQKHVPFPLSPPVLRLMGMPEEYWEVVTA